MSLVFGEVGPPSRSVTFESLQRPHDDELTLLLVRIDAEGLCAESSIETLGGDGGIDLDSERPTKSGSTSEGAALSSFLESLASGPLWAGQRRWGSLGNELVVAVSVDALGHVTLEFTLAPQPWRPTWTATCTTSLTLGDLQSAARDLRNWVMEAIGA